MKLLIYSHYFYPSVGGVETVVLDLAKAMAARRRVDGSPEFEVTVVTQTVATDQHGIDWPFRLARKPSTIELWKMIRAADVVHVAGPALMPIAHAVLARKPVVVEHHGFQAICPTGQLLQEPENIPCPGHFMAGRHSMCLRCSSTPHRFASARIWALTFLRRYLCKRVSANIVPTAWVASQLDLPKSIVVHHGLAISPPSSGTPMTNSKEIVVFAFVGRLVSTKGLKTLLEACEILQAGGHVFELLVVGDGPQRSSIEAQIGEKHLSSCVHVLGHLPGPQLTEVLAKVSAVVVPSLGGEVFGMVVAENMLGGIPVLASDLGSFAEVLGDCGILFKMGDAHDLARHMATIVNNPSSLQHLRRVGRQRIEEHFTINQMSDRHASVYEQVILKK